MTVKAKFICDSLTAESYGTEAVFHAIYGTEGENADFATATPSGNLRMVINNETKAATFFEIGKSYYLTFELAGE